jgi:hypothetical protein
LIVPLKRTDVAALTVPDAVRFAVLILFDTFRLVSVPILVMFGWFAVVILALIVPALILFATFKFCRPLILVMFASAELKVPALTVPCGSRKIVSLH